MYFGTDQTSRNQKCIVVRINMTSVADRLEEEDTSVDNIVFSWRPSPVWTQDYPPSHPPIENTYTKLKTSRINIETLTV